MSSSLRAYTTSTTSRAMKMSPSTMTAASRPRTSRPLKAYPDGAAPMVKPQATSSSSVASRRPFLGSKYDKSAPSSVKMQPDIAAITARTQAVPTLSKCLQKSPTATRSLPEEHSDIWIQIATEEAAKVPAVKTSAVKTSAVKVPAAKVPAAKVPAVKVPAVTVPAVTVPAVKVSATKLSAIERAERTKDIDALIAKRQALEERLALREVRLAALGIPTVSSKQQKAAPRPQRTRVPSRGCEEAPQLKGPPKRGSRLVIRAVSISTIASDSDNSTLGRTPSSTSTSSNEQMSRISLEGLRLSSASSTSSNEQMSRISLEGLPLSSSTSTSANEQMSRISVADLELASPEPIDFDLSFDGAFEGTILEDHRDLSFPSVESGTSLGCRTVSATSTTANEQMSRILPEEILIASLAPKPLKSCLKRPSTKASVKNVAWHPQYTVRLQPKWIDPIRDVFNDDHVWACGQMRRFGNDNYVFGDHYDETHSGCGCTYERLQNSPRRHFS